MKTQNPSVRALPLLLRYCVQFRRLQGHVGFGGVGGGVGGGGGKHKTEKRTRDRETEEIARDRENCIHVQFITSGLCYMPLRLDDT